MNNIGSATNFRTGTVRTDTDNNDKNPNERANSSKGLPHKSSSVRRVQKAAKFTPKIQRFNNPSSAPNLSMRGTRRIQNFNELITQTTIDSLVSVSSKYGTKYDGKKHSQCAQTIKQYTSTAQSPLNLDQISKLAPLLEVFKPATNWEWRSLTTTLHSFTSAGVFTPHEKMDKKVKDSQSNLLSTLLDEIKLKCDQKPAYTDAQGITNLLWAMAKLMDNGLEWTAELKAAVAALLPQVNREKDQFNTQAITNLLWAMAKLVDNGLERTAELKAAVAALLPRVNVKKDQFNAQAITNLLWAMAKLVDNGLELTAELKATVAALLPRVNAKKASFNPQEINNLLWAMAKLMDNGLERTAELKAAVAALLPLVNREKDQFNAQAIANLMGAMAKLMDNGLERTAELKAAVPALLPRVNVKKDQFNAQAIANLLWAMAKLVDNGLNQPAELKAAVAALLPRVNAKKDQFNAQAITNLLGAMAKLVDNGLERTAELKAAMAALLPQVNMQKDQFDAQAIANLLWAMAKLVDNGLERTAELKAAVPALLPRVNVKKDQFNAQAIANLLWAMAKLADNGLEQTKDLTAAVASLLPQVNMQKDQFNSQAIANLLWAMAKLGEAIELSVVEPLFESLVRISENSKPSQQGAFMSLWAVMAYCARLALRGEAIKNLPATRHSHAGGDDDRKKLNAPPLSYNATDDNLFTECIRNLFTRLKTNSPVSVDNQPTLAMAASWLNEECPVTPHYKTTTSEPQSEFLRQLRIKMQGLNITEEKSLNSLPPVDLLLTDYPVVIEIQGPVHYVGNDFKIRNGSTLLKIALLQKLGFRVIEIPTNQLNSVESIGGAINRIDSVIKQSVPLKSGEEWENESNVTADVNQGGYNTVTRNRRSKKRREW
ncbi:RAP domain-containing protein [uncultured Endozoicomonas sp.]|uniref:RAP domain-containing protein n=1 Tax=uncultured Endozoicomonas sp. TaxID=432652 RepID=UPI0026169EE1|nr:RAP domain-containing protein [uncultured Endozoicomonas sp.]